MRDSNGEYKWFLARARPLKSSDGQLIKWYGSWTQIQDQKMMSEILELKVQERTNELNKSNAQLIRSNNELEQFATVASHDLQEPARKIHIYSNIIKDRCLAGDHSETMLYIDKIISSSARMRRLIVDLLDLSSVSNKAVFENTDLNVVIANVLTDLEWVLKEKKASVIIGELPVIEVMAVQMEQVFLNLIGNAIKFSRPATAPIIDISAQRVEACCFNALPAQQGDYLRIAIADNGIGFSNQYVDLIFKIFQKLETHKKSDGTGIGLAIVKKILDNHNGIITAESVQNEGSVFTIVMPVKQAG
jgi:two-component system CheB/CheR fusion protein